MRLSDFVPADPRSPSARQELVRGAPRPLGDLGGERGLRALQLGTALASAVKRAKAKAQIVFGGGYGYQAEEGDEYRIADLLLALPDRRGRAFEPAVVCLLVADPVSAEAEEMDRLRVFQACPTVKEILLLAVAEPLCRAYRRHAALWSLSDFAGPDAVVPLTGLKTSLFLSSAYADRPPGAPG